MAFPTQGWPPPAAPGNRTIRFRVTSTATANWSDNAYLFIDGVVANTFQPTPYIRPGDTTTVVNVTSPMGAGQQPADAFPPSSTGTPKPAIWSSQIWIRNTGANPIEISFTAINDASTQIQGIIPAGTTREFKDRREAGIALRSTAGATFELEAW